MKTKTINISLPSSLYQEAKKHQKEYYYTSISEMIRDALRWWINPRLTRNGFTPEFEKEVLESEKEPIENSIEWNGKGSFVDFIRKHPIKHHGKNTLHRLLSKKTRRVSPADPEAWEQSGKLRPLVP